MKTIKVQDVKEVNYYTRRGSSTYKSDGKFLYSKRAIETKDMIVKVSPGNRAIIKLVDGTTYYLDYISKPIKIKLDEYDKPIKVNYSNMLKVASKIIIDSKYIIYRDGFKMTGDWEADGIHYYEDEFLAMYKDYIKGHREIELFI